MKEKSLCSGKKGVWGRERRGNRIWIHDHWPPLAKDVQVDGGGFPQSMEDFVDLLDVQPLLRFPLPAPQHDIVHLFGADSGPLQNTTLGDALNDLKKRGEQGSYHQSSALALWLRRSRRQWLHWWASVQRRGTLLRLGRRRELLACPVHGFQGPWSSTSWSSPLLPSILHLLGQASNSHRHSSFHFSLPL